jgi:chemotaxis protein MotB
MKRTFLYAGALILTGFFAAGCMQDKARKSPEVYEREIADLTGQINEKDSEIKRLMDEKETETAKISQGKQVFLSSVDKARQSFEQLLSAEISAKKAGVAVTDRGLVVTITAENLFEPGRDITVGSGKELLKKISAIMNNETPFSVVAVEGHTDNDPIKFSGWRSNWELSTARALSVLHELENGGVKPEKLSAAGYGEYRPVAGNDTPEGKKQNRRVELVIMQASEDVKPPALAANTGTAEEKPAEQAAETAVK